MPSDPTGRLATFAESGVTARSINRALGRAKDDLVFLGCVDEYLDNLEAKARRVLTRTQSGRYTKELMAHDLLRVIVLARDPIGHLAEYAMESGLEIGEAVEDRRGRSD